MDHDYGFEDASNYTDICAYSFNNVEQKNIYGTDRMNDFLHSTVNDYFEENSEERNFETNEFFSPDDGPDLNDDKKHSISSDLQEKTSHDEDIKQTDQKFDFLVDHLSSLNQNMLTNEKNINKNELENGNNVDDSCFCCNSSLMCLAFFCDCFGI